MGGVGVAIKCKQSLFGVGGVGGAIRQGFADQHTRQLN